MTGLVSYFILNACLSPLVFIFALPMADDVSVLFVITHSFVSIPLVLYRMYHS
jgi:hypothetical protein